MFKHILDSYVSILFLIAQLWIPMALILAPAPVAAVTENAATEEELANNGKSGDADQSAVVKDSSCDEYSGEAGTTVAQPPADSPAGLTLACDAEDDVEDVSPTGTISVNTIVVNQRDGQADASDFLLFVNEHQVEPDALNDFAPGLYHINQWSLVRGYTEASFTCYDQRNDNLVVTHPINLADGDIIHCEFVNTDNASWITVFSQVINDDEGQAEATDFQLLVNGFPVVHNEPYIIAGDSHYTISTLDIAGYKHTGTTCHNITWGSTHGASLYVPIGSDIGCIVTNDDTAPARIRKAVFNRSGGGSNGPVPVGHTTNNSPLLEKFANQTEVLATAPSSEPTVTARYQGDDVGAGVLVTYPPEADRQEQPANANNGQTALGHSTGIASSAEPHSATNYGPYVVVALIAAGAAGAYFLIQQPGDQKTVARNTQHKK